jgi:hypothetical protein
MLGKALPRKTQVKGSNVASLFISPKKPPLLKKFQAKLAPSVEASQVVI